MIISAGTLKRRIRVERSLADDEFDGAGSDAWVLVCEVAASVIDMMPSRGERLAAGINVAARPARVRIRYRGDVSSAMRVLVGRNLHDDEGNTYWQTDRTAAIITVPAELGLREGLEFMIEDYTSPGGGA